MDIPDVPGAVIALGALILIGITAAVVAVPALGAAFGRERR